MTNLTKLQLVLVVGFLIGGIVVSITGSGDVSEAGTAVVPPTPHLDPTSTPTAMLLAPASDVRPTPTPAPAAIQSSDGLVSWWPGDGNANDIVGGNDGTLSGGATFAPGMVGQAFSFDGVDGVVRAGIEGITNNNYTFSAWAKLDSLPGSNDQIGIISVGSSVGDQALSVHNGWGGEIGFAFISYSSPTTTKSPTSGVLPTTDVWYHVAGVRNTNDASLRLYVNGLEVDSSRIGSEAAVYFPDPVAEIGQRGPGPGQGSPATGVFHGLIDEVEIYNRALTAAEIKAIFDAGSVGMIKPAPSPVEPPSGLVAWWPGDGNANDIVGDNDGTLAGDTTFATGMVGQAFSFDGAGDYVDITSGFNLGNRSFSVDMWILYEDAGQNGNVFVWGATSAGTPSEAGLQVKYVDTGQIAGNVRDEDGNSGILVVAGQAPEPGVFHHVALVLDREDDRFELYINGTQAAFENIPEVYAFYLSTKESIRSDHSV